MPCAVVVMDLPTGRQVAGPQLKKELLPAYKSTFLLSFLHQTQTHYLCSHLYEDKKITQRQGEHHYAGLQQEHGG